MRNIFRRVAEFFLKPLGFQIVRSKTLDEYKSDRLYAEEWKFLLQYPLENAYKYLSCKKLSRSQIRQDLFVLSELNFKKKGFFVEFGASDGISFSNSFLLEKEFGWEGILAEPAKCWHEALFKNRSSHIEKKCVWSYSGQEVEFNEVEKPSLSTIEGFGDNDYHQQSRKKRIRYKVETLSLMALLEKYEAPEIIDYLSIDTEGSELEILEHFDFNKYKFRIITVEHNYSPMRQKIFNLLSSKGYKRVHQEFSLFDDWYKFSF
ncbi:FkbM family methyltransferase [Salinimicrobium tongyeongense]|uniref:FkbM family methyltransferase n=1 Tax=Salinimicrobium tongyeongense TaxID=2809707 RepID=A0ABY6NRX0_9FLAO|nr:FkbM family methyltransferase [Salinimicrobium tongyeongense]UZH55647.1 FkbM family methyltransferase [Salinimicrobium tongyeongense]